MSQLVPTLVSALGGLHYVTRQSLDINISVTAAFVEEFDRADAAPRVDSRTQRS